MREGLLQSSEPGLQFVPQKSVSPARQDVLRTWGFGDVSWRLAVRPLAGDAEQTLEMEGT